MTDPPRGRSAAMPTPPMPRGSLRWDLVRSRSVLATAILAASIIVRLLWDTLTVNGRNFVDLHVYRDGSAGLADGSLYLFTYSGSTDFALPFTYPPFAAVVLYPLSLLPWGLVALLWELATFAALYGSVVLALRLCGRRSGAYTLAAVWSAIAIWCEPVRVTLDYGQINVYLMFATLLAVSWARSRRGQLAGGALIGLIAGIKLTPAITGLWYLAVRKPLGAVAAALAFGATILGCLIFFPEVTRTYYGSLIGDADRIGPVARVINQSLRGALSRIAGHDIGSSWLWLAAVAVAVVFAVAAWRAVRDDAFGVLMVVQLLGLLVSPISWVHHWVWLLPLAIWLVHGNGARRTGARVLLGLWVVVAAAGIPWILKMIEQSRYELAPAATAILGTAWSVLALATLAWIALAPTTRRRTEVVAAAIIDDGRLLLAQRSKPTDLAGKWELPGGRVEAGETAHEAVRREIREELGVDVEPLQRVGGEVPLRDDLVLRAYAARLTAGTPRALEHLDLRWMSADDLRAVDLDDVVPADREWLPTLIGMLATSGVEPDGPEPRANGTVGSPTVDEPQSAG